MIYEGGIKVDISEKKVLDFVKCEDFGALDNYVDKMYSMEKYLAMGGKLDAMSRMKMRKHICEVRQYLQSGGVK